jgi:hypothetical protein
MSCPLRFSPLGEMSLRAAGARERNRTPVFTLEAIWFFDLVRSLVAQIVSKFLIERKRLSIKNNEPGDGKRI